MVQIKEKSLNLLIAVLIDQMQKAPKKQQTAFINLFIAQYECAFICWILLPGITIDTRKCNPLHNNTQSHQQ